MASGPLHGHRTSTRLERSRLNARIGAVQKRSAPHNMLSGWVSARFESVIHCRTCEVQGRGQEEERSQQRSEGTGAEPKLGELTITWTIGGDSGFGARRTRGCGMRPRTLPRWRWVPCHIEERKKTGECGTTVKQKFGKEAVRCVHRRMKARLLGVWLRQGHGKEGVD